MAEVRSNQDLWQAMLAVPHRRIHPLALQYAGFLRENPDFTARALVHHFRTTKIRDQQDAACLALMTAGRGGEQQLYQDYRNAGKAMLLGDRVYKIEPSGPWGVDPYRIFRVIDIMTSPWVVTSLEGEEGRYHSKGEAEHFMPRLARRCFSRRDKKWRPAEMSADEVIAGAGLTVSRDQNHLGAPRLAKRLVEDFLNALQVDPDWWYAVDLVAGRGLRRLYLNKRATPRGFSPPGWVLDAVHRNQYPADSKRGVLRQIAEGQFEAEEVLALVKEHRLNDRILASVLGNTPIGWVIRLQAMTPHEARILEPRLREAGLLEMREVKQAWLEKIASGDATVSQMTRAHGGDTEAAAALKQVRDRAASTGPAIEGNILVMVDASGSMGMAVDASAPLAALICARASDKVTISFFDDAGRAFDVTDHRLSQIERITSRVRAGGMTSFSAGWEAAQKYGVPNKVVFLTDGGENVRPFLASVLEREGWEGKIISVLIGDSIRDVVGANLQERGYVPETIRLESWADREIMMEQVVDMLAGAPARTLVDLISETQIPAIV
jgi:hypothetical protein